MPKLTKEMVDSLIKEAMLQERFPAPPANLNVNDLKSNLGLFSATPRTAHKPEYLNAFMPIVQAGGGNPQKSGTKEQYMDAFLKIMKDDDVKADLSYDDIEAAYKRIRSETKAKSEKISQILKGLTDKFGGQDAKDAHDTNIFIIDSFRTQSNLSSYMHNPNFVPTPEQIEKYSVFQAGIDTDPKLGDDKTKDQTKADIFDFDIRNVGSAAGEFPPALKNVFDVLFKDKTTFLERIGSLNSFSQNLINAAKTGTAGTAAQTALKNMGLQKYIQHIMAMDYVTSCTRGMEGGSGAYIFEVMLALMAGGRVTGKEGETGLMGAVDFTMAGGIKGSSKYYSTFKGLSQSAKGFNVGDVLYYVVAIKKDEKDAGTADPIALTSLDIHWIIIKCLEKSGDLGTFQIVSPEDNLIENQVNVSKVKFESAAIEANTKIGTMYLASQSTDTFRQTAQQATNQIGDKFKEAMELMQSAFAQSVETKDNVTDYLAGGRMQKGNDAVVSIISMEDSLRQMFELLPTIQQDTNGEGYEDVSKAGELRTLQSTTENKQKKFQDLDKMIEELMLEYLQGNINDNN